jgi:hypothetical protein
MKSPPGFLESGGGQAAPGSPGSVVSCGPEAGAAVAVGRLIARARTWVSDAMAEADQRSGRPWAVGFGRGERRMNASTPNWKSVNQVDDRRERLTRRLFEEIEYLDPSLDEKKWETLSPRERHLYFACIDAILQEVRQFGWGTNFPNDSRISAI